MNRNTHTTLFATLLTFCTLAQATAQTTPAHEEAGTPYTLVVPTGWQTEHFALPPEFAPSFTYTGSEDIRFAPGWGDIKSEEHWAYSYLWWLNGTPAIDAATLTSNLKAYYTGLVSRNVANVPQEKIVPTTVTVKKIKAASGDRETYSATINMFEYHEQKPVTLNGVIHVKKITSTGHTAVYIEISPKPLSHDVWKKMDEIGATFSIKGSGKK